MARYFSRPRAAIRPRMEWDDEYPMIPCLTVDDHEAVDTGLVDGDGYPIMRAPNPIGFGRDEEW